MSRCSCEICQEETGFLTCPHVGPVCFDCWGSGIHETMVRKATCWKDFMNHVLGEVQLAILTCDFTHVFKKYGIIPCRKVEVAS